MERVVRSQQQTRVKARQWRIAVDRSRAAGVERGQGGLDTVETAEHRRRHNSLGVPAASGQTNSRAPGTTVKPTSPRVTVHPNFILWGGGEAAVSN